MYPFRATHKHTHKERYVFYECLIAIYCNLFYFRPYADERKTLKTLSTVCLDCFSQIFQACFNTILVTFPNFRNKAPDPVISSALLQIFFSHILSERTHSWDTTKLKNQTSLTHQHRLSTCWSVRGQETERPVAPKDSSLIVKRSIVCNQIIKMSDVKCVCLRQS